LKSDKLLPYKARAFYRLSLFSYKLVNGHFLSDIKATLKKLEVNTESRYPTRSKNKKIEDKLLSTTDSRIYDVPRSVTLVVFRTCLTIAIPALVNKVLKDSISQNFKDFKSFLNCNLILLFSIFEEKFLSNFLF
jgi:hypothetical protein